MVAVGSIANEAEYQAWESVLRPKACLLAVQGMASVGHRSCPSLSTRQAITLGCLL